MQPGPTVKRSADLVTDAHPVLRSYGRRKGHGLTDRRESLVADLLPRLALDLTTPCPPSPAQLFTPATRHVWFEIGFGGAEHLLWQATNHPDTGLIGCEPFINGVAKALSGIDDTGLGNIRLHAEDARDVLAWLPPASIDRAFILFPDPWPKKRHRKRRIVSVETLAMLARVMPAGAELRLATDITSYARAMLDAVIAEGSFAWQAKHPDDWRQRPADWPQTRYEQKAIQAGRSCCYFRFQRR
jgi:tRNA (guanine-N7-)-methyltransferase